ncbi:hypothetical protein, partial [Mesorhizobium sp. M2D.F.Ca.ET.153.01.1.1]|uniref:hypothetical protein n=1 Tax=Mesorhizobium sp. M2D.F.Ca.ET.153.01.1.1 TaxID=2500520 RepID=UPI001AED5D66
LARTGMAGDEQHLAWRNLEADIGQRLMATGVLFADIVEAQDTHAPIMQERRDVVETVARSVVPAAGRQRQQQRQRQRQQQKLAS